MTRILHGYSCSSDWRSYKLLPLLAVQQMSVVQLTKTFVVETSWFEICYNTKCVYS